MCGSSSESQQKVSFAADTRCATSNSDQLWHRDTFGSQCQAVFHGCPSHISCHFQGPDCLTCASKKLHIHWGPTTLHCVWLVSAASHKLQRPKLTLVGFLWRMLPRIWRKRCTGWGMRNRNRTSTFLLDVPTFKMLWDVFLYTVNMYCSHWVIKKASLAYGKAG